MGSLSSCLSCNPLPLGPPHSICYLGMQGKQALYSRGSKLQHNISSTMITHRASQVPEVFPRCWTPRKLWFGLRTFSLPDPPQCPQRAHPAPCMCPCWSGHVAASSCVVIRFAVFIFVLGFLTATLSYKIHSIQFLNLNGTSHGF